MHLSIKNTFVQYVRYRKGREQYRKIDVWTGIIHILWLFGMKIEVVLLQNDLTSFSDLA